MTTLEVIGECWEPADRWGTRGLPGLRVGATLHFGPFAGWAAPGVLRADAWWRPHTYVVRDEDIVRAAGAVEWCAEGIAPGQAFILRVPSPSHRRRTGMVASVIAAPVVDAPE